MSEKAAELCCYIVNISVLLWARLDEAFLRLCMVMQELGLSITDERSTPPPSLPYSGIDIVSNTVSFTEGKWKDICDKCAEGRYKPINQSL